MPRPKKMPDAKIEINPDPVYGVWGISREYPGGAWVMTGGDCIVQSDFIGIARAYVNMMKKNGMNVSVAIIDAAGFPVELEE